MDNNIFRSALNGFNRQDVMTYIEKTQSDAAARIAQLEDRVRALQESGEAQRQALESAGAERDGLLGQLEEARLLCSRTGEDLEVQRQTAESVRADVSARDTVIERLTAEKERLARRVQDLEEQADAFRLDKERVAQLELEARQRAADTVEEAQRQAADILAQAQARADSLEARAKAQTDTSLRETEAFLAAVAEQYNSLFSSFESISGHVSSELRRMDVIASQLPLNFNHLQEGLQAVLDKARERS